MHQHHHNPKNDGIMHQNLVKKRFVFLVGGSEATHSLPTLSERAAAKEAQENRNYLNLETDFRPNNPEETLQALAQQALEIGQKTSFNELRNSFQNNLDPKEDLNSFWAFLQKMSCKTIAIINGNPTFFAGPGRTLPIDISSMLRPLSGIIGNDPLSKEKKLEAQAGENATVTALGALMAGIDLSKLGKMASNVHIPARYQHPNQNPKTNIA